MSKNYKTLLFAFGLGTLGAAAQSVTVVLNDGTQQKFCTDYVRQITIEEVKPQAPTIALTQIEIPYSGSNFGLKLTDAFGDNEFCLDLYGPADAQYVTTGTYVVGATEGLRVDNSKETFTYVRSGDVKKGVKSGTVEISREDRKYTILADLVLADGTQTRGKFIGELPKFSYFIDMTLSAASYNTNPQPQGQFYVKFNDAAWNCEMAVVFCADPAATTLPAGKYVYADTEAPGTISPKTYITIYSPYLSLKPAPGTEVDVKLDGTKYTVTMDFIYDNGRSGTMTFSGEISETPTFTEAPANTLKRAPLPYFKPKR
jgi:hypothetical protein